MVILLAIFNTKHILRGLDLRETILPEILRDEGNYTNYALGKWHLGHYVRFLNNQ